MIDWKSLPLALVIASIPRITGQGLVQTADQQCVGKYYDESRLESLEKNSVNSLVTGSFSRDGQAFEFVTRKVKKVVPVGENLCKSERHRIREAINGIPIFGADFVVTLDYCSRFDQGVMQDTNTLASMDLSFVRSVDGNIVGSVSVPTGYGAKRSKEEARKMVAKLYQVSEEKVTTISMEIYPTDDQDYRAWIATVLVDKVPGEPRLYQAVVDDETESIILQCDLAGIREKTARMARIRRQLGNDKSIQRLDPAMCTSCASYTSGIAWDPSNNVECDVSTLYLSNEGRKTLCIQGTDADNNTYVGPGAVQELFWGGTVNCNSGTMCAFSPIPECKDAINDIQWGAVNFLQYMQKAFDLRGGLVKEVSNPKRIFAQAHFDRNFCNAYFVPDEGGGAITFGDCDCDIFGPLVSTDVVVHEIVHGITAESSGLIYFFQSGGLNEAYSDIMACAMEFVLDDSLDTPDFTVGEKIAGAGLGRDFLRHMEFPSEDGGNSIDDFCGYEVGMKVHYSSGYLNRAFVNAVRACEATCGETADCAILMANTFMYANLETLGMSTNFRQAAEQTCRNIDDYFLAHSPRTRCTIRETRSAIIEGFKTVGVSMSSQENCFATITCEEKSFGDQCVAGLSNLLDFGLMILKAMCTSARDSVSFALGS